MFLLFLVLIKGWYGLYRIEETKLVCVISREFCFGWKAEFVGIGGPEMVLKWIQNGVKMNPEWFQMVPNGPITPIPIPIPGVSKSLLPGGKQTRKQQNDHFLWSSWNKLKKYPARGLKKGSARKLHPPFSRRGPKRGNPTMRTSTITARSNTMLRGKNWSC